MPSLSENILNCEIISISISSNQAQNIQFYGGSEEGQFVFIEKFSDDLLYRDHSTQDNILIKIEETPISGYRLKDVKELLSVLQKNHDIIHMKLIHNDKNFPRDLRSYLGLRFAKESPEHELQQIIRENLYLRTVPCTTRAPRAGEIDGVDYCFVSLETFCHLQKTDQLIEFGVFEGNLYGTPRPSCSLEEDTSEGGSAAPSPSPPSSLGRQGGERGDQLIGADSGISSVTTDDIDVTVPSQPQLSKSLNAVVVVTTSYTPPPCPRGEANRHEGCGHYEPLTLGHTPSPSPQIPPPKQNGYHRGRIQKSRSTPAFAPFTTNGPDVTEGVLNLSLNSENQTTKKPSEIKFSKNPQDLSSNLLGFYLAKGEAGFGFTILGNSERDKDYLYVNKIFPNSPACIDGNLARGDILAFVNDICVLGYSHSDILDMFRSIPVGSVVQLIVCRNGHDSSTTASESAVHPSTDRQRFRARPLNLPLPIKNGETFPPHPHQTTGQLNLNSHTPVKYASHQRLPPLNPINENCHSTVGNPKIGDTGQHRENKDFRELGHLYNHKNYLTSTSSVNNISAHKQNPNLTPSPACANANIRDLLLDLPLYNASDASPVEDQLMLCGGADLDGSCIKISRSYYVDSHLHSPLLQAGDILLSLDGQSVLKAAQFQALSLLRQARAAGKSSVRLGIRRTFVNTAGSSLNGNLGNNGCEEDLTIFSCTLQRSTLNEGFGFIILSALDGRSGSYINKIIPDSPADKCPALRVGQRILAVNGINVNSFPACSEVDNYNSQQTPPDPLSLVHGQIVELVKSSGLTLNLILAQPINAAATNDRDMAQTNGNTLDHNRSSPLYEEKRGELEDLVGVECEYVGVELFKGTRGFGFSIRGGTEFQRMPLYVYRIAEGGPAHRDGRIKVGDEIVEINGIKTDNLTHNQALELMKSGEHVVRLMIKRQTTQNPFDL